MAFFRNFPEAEAEIREGLALDPNSAYAHQVSSWFNLEMGRIQEAVTEGRKAVELEPLSPFYNQMLGFAYYYQRDYNHSIEQENKILEIDPKFAPALLGIASAYWQMGNYKQAMEQRTKVERLEGNEEHAKELRRVFEKAGYKGFLWEVAKDDEATGDPYWIAGEYAMLGETKPGGPLSTLPLDDFKVNSFETQRLLEGDLLAGRFRIVRFIASGGMGEVYEADDQELHERVALKVIRPQLLAAWNVVWNELTPRWEEPGPVARFRREVHLARKVTHPNVCRIFDLSRHKPESGNELVFITMELLHGKTLQQQLEAEGPMNVDEALSVVQQMASALGAAHEVGIVHRDFKPGNVILVGEKPWRVVVTDFGLAVRAASAISAALMTAAFGVSSTEQSVTVGQTDFLSTGERRVGTLAYMAPEQIGKQPPTRASDIYALGLVMYEMVTGHRPFGDDPTSALKRLSEAPIQSGDVGSSSEARHSATRPCHAQTPRARYLAGTEHSHTCQPGSSHPANRLRREKPDR